MLLREEEVERLAREIQWLEADDQDREVKSILDCLTDTNKEMVLNKLEKLDNAPVDSLTMAEVIREEEKASRENS